MGCENCAKRRAELQPTMTVRVVQEQPSLAHALLYGATLTVGMIAAVKLAAPLFGTRTKEVPV